MILADPFNEPPHICSTIENHAGFSAVFEGFGLVTLVKPAGPPSQRPPSENPRETRKSPVTTLPGHMSRRTAFPLGPYYAAL